VLSCADDDEAVQVGIASLARRRHFCRGLSLAYAASQLGILPCDTLESHGC
jgi:hypothetical protein